MRAELGTVLLYSAVPVATTAGGAAAAAFWRPGQRIRSGLQHFAAGVVFSVVAVELLPDVTRVSDLWEVAWTFALGLGLMLGVRWLGSRLRGGEEESSASPGLLVAVGVDVLIDGFLVGIAFAAGSTAGILLTAALSLELLSLGLVLATGLTRRGRRRAILVPTALALLLLLGAAAGATLLGGASAHTLAGVLSFGCAALLYLVTEELLVEAHECPENMATTSLFFVGFLIFLLLGMLE